MARPLASLLLSGWGALIVLGCGGGSSPPPLGDVDSGPPHREKDGGHDSGKTGSGGAGGTSPTDGGGATEASTDASMDAPSDASTLPDVKAVDVDYDALKPAKPACSPTGQWSSSSAPLGFGPGARLLAITPNETTVVFSRTTSGATAYYYADRASPAGAFGTPRALDTFANLDPSQGFAVAADGLVLVGARDTHVGFAQIARHSLAEPFVGSGRVRVVPPAPPAPVATDAATTANPDGSVVVSDAGAPLVDAGDLDASVAVADEAPFTTFNVFAIQAGEVDSAPVISENGTTLYYHTDIFGFASVKTATKVSGSWGDAQYLSATLFSSGATGYKLPTGISADELTLYFLDTATPTEKAASRDVPGIPFDTAVTIGAFPDAKPNAACTRLYFTASGDVAYASSL
jgi:hypothetical protein